ncbi:MAG: hypothetical protein SFX19_03870 [Alphaproteobacteria bacterium]|nr:hypothetical protein [Alphaproteobacteria bacterium]
MDNYGNHNAPPGMTLDQAKKLGEQTYEKNQKELAKGLQLTADEDGKYNVFGVEVPKTLAPAINVAIDTLITPFSGMVADVVYQHTRKIAANNFKATAESAHGTALTAELIARWGIILANPIGKFVSANANYGQEIFKLHGELKSVCEATSADYQHNKVVSGALHEASERYTERLTLILPSLMALIPQVVWGMQMQHNTAAKRAAEFGGGNAVSSAVDDVVKKRLESVTSKINLQLEQEKLHEEQYKVFKKTRAKDVYKLLDQQNANPNAPEGYGGYNKDYQTSDQRERKLREWFDRNVWQEALNHIKEEEKALRTKTAKGSDGHSPDKPTDNMLLNQLFFAAPALSAAGQGIQSSMAEAQKKQRGQASSYKLILGLKEHMQGKQSVEWVQEQVIEIFQKVEEEIGGGNTRFSGGLLERLKDSIRPVAEHIASGKLDPLSLVKLAGEDMIIEHKHKTKTFRSEASIQKTLDDMCCTQLIAGSETSEKEFLGRFAADHAHVKEAIKKTLADMPAGPEKGFMASILPAEVLKEAGISKEEIRDLRKSAREHLHDQVAAAILHIAAMDEEMLKEHGVSTKEIEQIKKLNDSILQGNREALEQLVDSKNEIITVVAAEGLNEQLAGNAMVWTERVGEAKKLESIIEAAKQKKEERTAPRDEHGSQHADEHGQEMPPEEHEKPMLGKHDEHGHAHKHKHPKSPLDHARRDAGASHFEQGA